MVRRRTPGATTTVAAEGDDAREYHEIDGVFAPLVSSRVSLPAMGGDTAGKNHNTIRNIILLDSDGRNIFYCSGAAGSPPPSHTLIAPSSLTPSLSLTSASTTPSRLMHTTNANPVPTLPESSPDRTTKSVTPSSCLASVSATSYVTCGGAAV